MKSAVKTVSYKIYFSISLFSIIFSSIALYNFLLIIFSQVKDGGKGVKSAYKGWRSRMKDHSGPHQLQNGLENGEKPRSAPNSPTGKRRTIGGLSAPMASYRKDNALNFKSSSIQRLAINRLFVCFY